MDVSEIERMVIDDRYKGIPGGTEVFELRAIDEKGWNVLREDLPLPLAILKRSGLDNNRTWMLRYLSLHGAAFCPHGKAVMAPQLAKELLDAGAWGISVANVSQLQVYRRYGVSRIIFANQLVGRQTLRYVFDELARDPEFELFGLVDSLDGVAVVADTARQRKLGRPLPLLIEVGEPDARNGCRTPEAALKVARAVKEAEPWLTLRGVEGYEGILPASSMAQHEGRVAQFLEHMIEIARRCAAEDLLAAGPVLLSAGGSQFWDMVAERLSQADIGHESLPVIRAGSFLTHDSGMYVEAFKRALERSSTARSLGGGLQPATEIWSYVQSRPDPDKVILTMGKRDCSFGYGMPIPATWFRRGVHNEPTQFEDGYSVTRLDDQHAYMTVPPCSELRFGDMVCCGITHPTTFVNLWRLLCVVDDDYNVDSAVATFF